MTDFNDLCVEHGQDAVRLIIEKVIADARTDINISNADGVPSGFRLTRNSVEYLDAKQGWKYLSSLLAPVCQTRTSAGNQWGITFKLRDRDGKLHERTFPRTALLGDGREYLEELLSCGLILPPYNRGRFDGYITACDPTGRASCVTKTGWYENLYILPHKVYGRETEKVVFQQVRRFREYRCGGSLVEWEATVGALCKANSRLEFAVCLALSGAVLHLVGGENFAFHFYGPSSIGKSTILDVAASIWGVNVNSWRTTDNAAEGLCQQANDGMLCFDELSEADGLAADKLIYMIGNGHGKSRANRDGSARPSDVFRLILISSGECGLESKLRERGATVKAGQSVRLIEVPALVENGYGAFEALNGCESGDVLANKLKAFAKVPSGSVADLFLTRLCETIDYAPASLARLKAEWMVSHGSTSGQVQRVSEKFALVAATGEWAIEHGILNWPKGTAYDAADKVFKSWLGARGGSEAKELTDARDRLLVLITEHGSSRFETIGSCAYPDQKVFNKAGYKRLTDDGSFEYFILPNVFAREIANGRITSGLKVYLADLGLILRDTYGRYTPSINTGHNGQIRLYHVPALAIEGLQKTQD